MPIRIGKQGPLSEEQPIPVPEPEPEVSELEQVLSEAPQEQPAGPRFSADKVDPMVARYMTSDMGPFVCQNCDHFTETGECDIVSGPIDPEGVCILFTSRPQEPVEPQEPELPEEMTEEPYESA